MDLAKAHVKAIDKLLGDDAPAACSCSETKTAASKPDSAVVDENANAPVAIDEPTYVEAAKTGRWSVYNLGTGKGYSVLDLVKTFERVNGVPVPYEITDRRPGDIAVCYAGTAKAEKILGWKAEKGIEDMCRDAWNWQKSQE